MLFVTINFILSYQAQGGTLDFKRVIDWMGAKKQDPKKSLGFKQNPQKSLDQNLTPKFPSHKNFQKALNNFLHKK